MFHDSKHLRPAFKKANSKAMSIEEIDDWLMVVSKVVPAASAPIETDGIVVTEIFANTHTLTHDPQIKIDADSIEKIPGYLSLISACREKNVQLLMTRCGGELIVDFTPEMPFGNSEIFGRTFYNIVPNVFTNRKDH